MLLLVKTLIVRMHMPVILCLLSFGTASAQTIGNWTLNNTLGGTGSALNTVSAISAGPGVTSTSFNGSTEWYGQNGFPAGSSPNATAYLQFTITPNSGYEINIASVVLRIRRSNTGSPAGSGPMQWCLRSSLDGYAANLSAGTMNHNYANYSVPLTGFSVLPGAVTFRLYGYGVTVSSGGTSRFVLDNINIVGSLFILPLQLLVPEARAEENGDIKITWKADDITAGTKFTIAVYSSSGILLHRQQLLLDAGSQSVPVSLQKFSKGMYVLSVAGNNGVVSRPFLFPVP